MAPNYDNNIALISRGYVKDISRERDGLIRFFTDFLTEKSRLARRTEKCCPKEKYWFWMGTWLKLLWKKYHSKLVSLWVRYEK